MAAQVPGFESHSSLPFSNSTGRDLHDVTLRFMGYANTQRVTQVQNWVTQPVTLLCFFQVLIPAKYFPLHNQWRGLVVTVSEW